MSIMAHGHTYNGKSGIFLIPKLFYGHTNCHFIDPDDSYAVHFQVLKIKFSK